ncbi:kinase-like domain-containing protein [Pisolithus croceorrhizus]|nr:kinase-like domain-containing protein [Pisolithus croceorrhizus]KAI6097017.1 kinase-like domain-containing protein [Pisolithus croceorrhizus]KAI6149063.1 kinase-like domain-containing protein [Pisolithus thermaeus]
MEQQCPSPHTTHQQETMNAPSVLQRLADRASKFSISLDGGIRRTSGMRPPLGGTAIVYHGTWIRHGHQIPHGTEVAIKTFRNAPPESEVEIKRLLQEVHTWSKLRHENIVPMLGICTEFDFTISVISKWMPLGNAHDYVRNTEHDPRPLLEGIASGLSYLHNHNLGVVHGDLKGRNVLVSNDRRALLTDFGLSTLNISTFSMTVDPKHGFSLHWSAPELLDGCSASTASDVWAFGMTTLELFTREEPFSDCRSSSGLMTRILRGGLPHLPAAQSTQFRMTDAWWEICTSCWGYDPSSRPAMKDIVDEVKAALFQPGPFSTHPEASGSQRRVSEVEGSHPTPETLGVAGSDTTTGRTSESAALMKTAPECPASITDTSNSRLDTEFFTCHDVQPPLMSDL